MWGGGLRFLPDRKAGFPNFACWGVRGVGLGRGLVPVVDVELEIDGLGGSTQAMTNNFYLFLS